MKSFNEFVDDHDLDEAVDPASIAILTVGALAAFPIAKQLAKVVEPIVDWIKQNYNKEKPNKDILKRIELAKAMVDKFDGDGKIKMNAYIKSLESKLKY